MNQPISSSLAERVMVTLLTRSLILKVDFGALYLEQDALICSGVILLCLARIFGQRLWISWHFVSQLLHCFIRKLLSVAQGYDLFFSGKPICG